ncbi:MAG: carbon monoxide dehydrogenase, partial [Ardenticatenia bacterium]|nr:carbon monoxide dehydrogenase [Ardenticatenia bacterium]
TVKGFILGGLVPLPFALVAVLGHPAPAWWVRAGEALAYLLVFPPVTAYLALNFTGATTFTSKSGVKREMRTYIPVMAGMFGFGLALALGLFLVILVGG